jgi:hypothetical protein
MRSLSERAGFVPLPGVLPPVALNPRSNRLLASLPGEMLQELSRDLEPVYLQRGMTMSRFVERGGYLYLPTGAVFAVLCSTGAGCNGQYAMIGHEGGFGVPVGPDLDLLRPHRIRVQVAGGALRLPASIFDRLRGTLLHRRLQRFHCVLMGQIRQTADCNREHLVVERLCRWLLMLHDRVGQGELPVSPEFIFRRICAPREELDRVVGALERLGMLRLEDDRIFLLDRPALEASTCGCYERLRQEQRFVLRPGHLIP